MGRVFLSDLRYIWRKELLSHFVVLETGSPELNDSSKIIVPITGRAGHHIPLCLTPESADAPFCETGLLAMPSSCLPVASVLGSPAIEVSAS